MPVTHLFRVISIRKIIHIFIFIIIAVLKTVLFLVNIFFGITHNVTIINTLINVVKFTPIVSSFLCILTWFEDLHKILKFGFLSEICRFTCFLNLFLYSLFRKQPLKEIYSFISLHNLLGRRSIRIIFCLIKVISLVFLTISYILSKD